MVPLLALYISLFLSLLGPNLALPVNSPQKGGSGVVPMKRSFRLPIQRRRDVPPSRTSLKRGIYSGSTGLGDFLDLCAAFFHCRADDN
jgi:hypothetical protein